MHDDRNDAYTIAHGCSIYILRLHVWTNLFMCSSKDLAAEDFRVLDLFLDQDCTSSVSNYKSLFAHQRI